MDTTVIALIIGVVAGVLSGMFGIGGGVVIVPALIIFAGFSITMASGTSLAALLLPVGIFACIQYYRAGYLNIKTSAIIAAGLLGGVYFGAELALYLPNMLMKQAYGAFLLYVSWVFIAPLELMKIRKPKPEAVTDEIAKENFLILFLFGIFAGVLSGMFGIGGGIVITPFLMAVLKFNPKKAIGTSLGSLLLPVGLPGVIVYSQNGHLSLEYAAFMAAGIVVGAIFGAKITISLPAKKIKLYYGIFLLLMALDFIFQGLIAAKL